MKKYDEKGAGKNTENTRAAHFAQGHGFYKMASLFFISSVLGDAAETLFLYITTQKLVSRSSVLMTLLFTWIGKNRSLRIFMMGTAIGGVYEYCCSIFTEAVFGTVFWDYSSLPLNIGGRVTLLYCVFWGAAAVIWMKCVYPGLSGLIEKIPPAAGRAACNVFVVFMIVNIIISTAALVRYTQRYQGLEPSSGWDSYIDDQFPDEWMEQVYPYERFRVGLFEE